LVSYVRGDGGARIYFHRPVTHRALTPQVAYLWTEFMKQAVAPMRPPKSWQFLRRRQIDGDGGGGTVDEAGIFRQDP
jgi:fatty-acid desaturase